MRVPLKDVVLRNGDRAAFTTQLVVGDDGASMRGEATVDVLSRELRAEPTPQLDWSKVDFLEGVPVKVKQVVPVLEAVRITEPMIAAAVLHQAPLPSGVRIAHSSVDKDRKIIAVRCDVRRGGGSGGVNSHRYETLVAGDWVVTDDDGVRIVFSDAEFWKAFERVG